MNAYIVWNNKIRVKFKGKGKVIIIFQQILVQIGVFILRGSEIDKID